VLIETMKDFFFGCSLLSVIWFELCLYCLHF